MHTVDMSRGPEVLHVERLTFYYGQVKEKQRDIKTGDVEGLPPFSEYKLQA